MKSRGRRDNDELERFEVVEEEATGRRRPRPHGRRPQRTDDGLVVEEPTERPRPHDRSHGTVPAPSLLEQAIKKVVIKFATLGCLALLGVGALGILSLFSGGRGPDAPEVAAFKAANQHIVSWSDKAGFGNTPEAERLAADFSQRLQALQAVAFTGGADEANRVSLTDGNVISYCQLTDDGACFLVHVPQLKNYKRGVRDALIDLAWQSARGATEELRAAGDRKLAVGLRGSLMYGGYAAGPGNAETPASRDNGAVVSTDPLHAFFAPRGSAAAAITAR